MCVAKETETVKLCTLKFGSCGLFTLNIPTFWEISSPIKSIQFVVFDLKKL